MIVAGAKVALMLLTMVCHGPVSANNCDLYQQMTWTDPSITEMLECAAIATSQTRSGQSSRCEVADYAEIVQDVEEGDPDASADDTGDENNYLAQMGQSWRI